MQKNVVQVKDVSDKEIALQLSANSHSAGSGKGFVKYVQKLSVFVWNSKYIAILSTTQAFSVATNKSTWCFKYNI